MPRLVPFRSWVSAGALLLGFGAVGACGAEQRDRPAAEPAPATSTGAAGPEARRATAQTTRTAGSGPRGSSFAVRRVAGGLEAPVWVGSAPGDDGLWVAQQDGRLLRVQDGRATLRLSIAARTRASGEQGLLGVAFLPGQRTPRHLVLHSTNRSGDTRVELWRLGAAPGDARLVRTLLRVDQPYANHNGGTVAFGDRNRLYLGLGDGGGADDPDRRAQLRSGRLAKILVVRVTASTASPQWKVAAYGLRNPWRFWFDREQKQLWIADVGQDALEEIDRIPATGPAPNLGWSVYEGRRRNPDGDGRLGGGGRVVWPVIQYSHDHGCSVTGGEIYRGSGVPALQGRYVFGDFCSGTLWTARPDARGVGPVQREQARIESVTSFGSGPDGELYATSLQGELLQLVPAG